MNSAFVGEGGLNLYVGRRVVAPARWGRSLRPAGQVVLDTLRQRRAALLAVLAFGSLLTYLLIGRIISPGFTDYWGYHVAQLSFYLTAVIVGEALFRREGGLYSAPTLAVVVAAATVDVFGTTEDFYSTLVIYDKIVHFLGTAAFTAVVLDILLARAARRGTIGADGRLIGLGIILGVTAGIAWELYEYIGDTVFNSGRIQSRADTGYDILFDAFGALLMGTIASLRVWPIDWRVALLDARLGDPHS